MFKKKSESPRPRQRLMQPVPQNTAVFSYHARRAVAADSRGRNSQEHAEIPRRRRPLPVWLRPKNIMLATAALSLFVLLMGLGSTPKIVVTGDQSAHMFAQDTDKYQQTAEKLLRASPLNANKLTVDTAGISQKMAADFPELRAVSVSLPVFGRQPIVYVQVATPQLILHASAGDYILDSAGRALATVGPHTKLPTGQQALPVISDQSGLHVTTGSIALPGKSVLFIAEIVGQLHAKETTVEAWTLPARASELHAKIAGEPYYVKFNLQGKAREQSGTFIAVREYLEGQQAKPSEYIDARVPGRAYYK